MSAAYVTDLEHAEEFICNLGFRNLGKLYYIILTPRDACSENAKVRIWKRSLRVNGNYRMLRVRMCHLEVLVLAYGVRTTSPLTIRYQVSN